MYRFWYADLMEIPEVVTVSTARSKLSQILAELTEAGPTANPVLIGAHRKPQGVLLSIEAYEELSGRASRQAAVESARGSLATEGLHISEAAHHDTAEYVRGNISSDDLVQRAIDRHQSPVGRQAG